MKKQVAIIGLGRFGTSLASTLFSMGHEVLALDLNERKVQDISSEVTHAVQADCTNEAILKELGIANFDVAIVAMGSDIQNSVLSTILLKKLGLPYVIARANNELHGSILDKIGADKVVYPEQEMGTRVAHALTLTDVLDYISVAPTYGVAKLVPPASFHGKTLAELGLGREGKRGVAVLLIRRQKEVLVTPDRMEAIKPNDLLIVAGNDDKLEQLLTEFKL
ncbi:MAG: TrkA family potassium uptake protein [Chloroflexi bacterium]|nr:MAG: TrkA family potassium uptake protein [Chloroflexota bacterium]